MLLRVPLQLKLTPTTEGHEHEAADENHERRDDDVIGQPFASRWMTPELIVGPREYDVRLLFHLLVSDTLVLPYVDSTCVPRLSFPFLVERHCNSTRPFEPFIAAVLISRAQSSSPPLLEKEGAGVQTQLLFTHRDDQQNIHVYTAHISRALLDRFRYPNQPPAIPTDDIKNHFMDPLIRLDHRRVPYEPYATFRQRLLAAVSITPIMKSHLEGDPDCKKRQWSPERRAYLFNPKRRRRPESPRHPLRRLDLSLRGHPQPP
ncbi:hypothetical protein F4678DRAFT_295888 [Xylaria arbuscula]|nr:hypothetical protein F4678DRAFT_295888 [Xylaria arbuscula]